MPSRRVSKNISHRAYLARKRLIHKTVRQLVRPEEFVIIGVEVMGMNLPANPPPGTIIRISLHQNIGKVVAPRGWKAVFYKDYVEYLYR